MSDRQPPPRRPENQPSDPRLPRKPRPAGDRAPQPRRVPAQQPPEPPLQPEPPRRRGRRRAEQGPPPDRSGGLTVPWWIFVIVILAVAAVTCGMWYVVLANRGDVSETGFQPSPTPIFVMITATPTLGAPGETPGGVAVIGPTAEPETTEEAAAPTETPAEAEASATIGIGSQVRVDGTEGAGLAVRQGPGVDFTLFFVANDGDEFVVESGPREADGYNWWYISDPADVNRSGWAVREYLVVQTAGVLQEATQPPPEPTAEG